MPRLILASGSTHRRLLLERLGLPFDVVVPNIDESRAAGEAPRDLALRLATAKAEKAATAGALVIGSDQVAALEGEILRKPATVERAVEQLMRCRGKTVEFLTAATLIENGAQRRSTVDCTRVVFRQIDEASIRNYVAIESPLDCAGGFKAEGLGITLFERIDSTDPTALIGLPLIWLSGALRAAGLDTLAVTAQSIENALQSGR